MWYGTLQGKELCIHAGQRRAEAKACIGITWTASSATSPFSKFPKEASDWRLEGRGKTLKFPGLAYWALAVQSKGSSTTKRPPATTRKPPEDRQDTKRATGDQHGERPPRRQ